MCIIRIDREIAASISSQSYVGHFHPGTYTYQCDLDDDQANFKLAFIYNITSHLELHACTRSPQLCLYQPWL